VPLQAIDAQNDTPHTQRVAPETAQHKAADKNWGASQP